MTEFDAFSSSEYELPEQRLLSLNEVFVYKVPAMSSASGHRAEDWGLDKPLFTGLLRIFQKDDKLRVSLFAYKDPKSTLETDENLVPFCDCPVEVKPKGTLNGLVDAVIDSGRYFVLRAKDPASNRTTLIGIGFRERETSFDFKNVLNEYIRYIDRLHLAEELAAKRERSGGAESENGGESVAGDADDDTTSSGLLTSNLGDLSLKDGAKIVVNSRLIKKSSPNLADKSVAKAKGGTGGIMLAPPPPPGSTVFAKVSSPSEPASEAAAGDDDGCADDEFGDFETA